MRAEALAGGGPNMTPMVDVILVILIFFMATTVIVGEEWFLGAGLTRPQEARSPGAEAPPAPEDPFEMPPPRFTLRISVGEGGSVVSGLGEPVVVGAPAAMDTWAEQALGGLDRASLVIVVAPAPDVPYEHVVALHDALVRAQVGQIGLGGAPGGSP